MIWFVWIALTLVAVWYLFEWLWGIQLFTDGHTGFLRNVRVGAAKKLLQSVEPPALLDVRPEELFQKNRMAGARHIYFKDPDFDQKLLAQFQIDEPVLVYCSGGFLGRLAVSRLKELGFQRVYHLHRGIGSWILAGQPVERTK